MQAFYRSQFWFFPLLIISVIPSMAQQGEMLSPENVFRDGFGQWVAMSGDVVAVLGNTSQHPVSNTSFPVVSVFRFNGTNWAFEANLFSEDSFSASEIKDAIAIEGNRIAVGAAHVSTGAVVFFEYDGSQWIEQSQVSHTSSTSGFEDNFGSKVSLIGDQLAIPNTRERDGIGNLETLPQLTYLYQHDGAAWQPVDTLKVSDGADGTAFGASVASLENVVVIGDPLYSVSGTSREGTAYVFENDGGTWSLAQQLDAGPDIERDDRLGSAIATDGNIIAVGAIRDSVGSVVRTGAVYVFESQGGQWVKTARITANESEEDDYFGTSVAVDGDDMIIGAPGNPNPAVINTGGFAYYFRFDGSAWIQQAKLSLPDGVSDDQFGWSVDVENGWAVVGAYNKDQGGNARGEVHMYKLEDLISIEVGNTPDIPVAFEIAASVYPNPFNQQATLRLEMHKTESVHVGVYDALGRQVDVLIDQVLPIGKHNMSWHNDAHPPGVYFFRVTTPTTSTVTSGLSLH